jgi:hypothetical protein
LAVGGDIRQIRWCMWRNVGDFHVYINIIDFRSKKLASHTGIYPRRSSMAHSIAHGRFSVGKNRKKMGLKSNFWDFWVWSLKIFRSGNVKQRRAQLAKFKPQKHQFSWKSGSSVIKKGTPAFHAASNKKKSGSIYGLENIVGPWPTDPCSKSKGQKNFGQNFRIFFLNVFLPT